MTTPSPDVSVAVLDGQTLSEAIAGLETGPGSSALWQNLTGSGYSPQLDAAAGATVTQHSRGRGYTYLSVPFVSAQGATAQLVWDDVLGQPRTGYGLPAYDGGTLTRVDVHQVVNGQVQRTNSLVRQPNQDVELTDATGNVIQLFPLGSVTPGSAGAGFAAAAVSDCSICQAVVDILYGVVICGGVASYFICLFVCSGITVGVGVPICAIACAILVGLVCYITGNALKAAACQDWCG